MLRIEKEKTEDREITTVGVDLRPLNVKSGTAAGAMVGFLFAGLHGVLFGGLVGEVVHILSNDQGRK